MKLQFSICRILVFVAIIGAILGAYLQGYKNGNYQGYTDDHVFRVDQHRIVRMQDIQD